MMLISIIIPFYNSARYISRCLNTLLCQDLSNVEILCVDDGSTDNSSSIISNMIEQWNMSQHVHLVKLNQNSGVAHARNVGINTAKGDYVIFIDSDDYVSPDYIAVLKDAVIESEPDAVIFNYVELKKNGEQIVKTTECEPSSQKLIEGLLLNKFHSGPCNKLFKRSLYFDYHITFPEKYKIFEDKAAIFKLLYYSNKIRIIDSTLYFYDRSNENSITSSNKYKSLIGPSVGALSVIEQFFADKQISWDLKDAMLANKLFISGFIYLFGDNSDIKQHRSFLTRIPNRVIFKLGNVPFYYRLAVFFSQNHMSVFTKCLKLLYQSIKGIK